MLYKTMWSLFWPCVKYIDETKYLRVTKHRPMQLASLGYKTCLHNRRTINIHCLNGVLFKKPLPQDGVVCLTNDHAYLFNEKIQIKTSRTPKGNTSKCRKACIFMRTNDYTNLLHHRQCCGRKEVVRMRRWTTTNLLTLHVHSIYHKH